MSVEDRTVELSAKLKLVKEVSRHLQLSPEEYRLLLLHVVKDHLATGRRTLRDDQDCEAA